MCACTAFTQYIRELYWRYEYEEVVTPNIYNFDLWKTSGHADHYKDNMFLINIEKQEFGLKPMNCPGVAVCAHGLACPCSPFPHESLPVRCCCCRAPAHQMCGCWPITYPVDHCSSFRALEGLGAGVCGSVSYVTLRINISQNMMERDWLCYVGCTEVSCRAL